MNAAPYRPVVIVGAPRSGTNMLRDALTRLPGWATWPCDEINYIWRHGNVRHPSDEFPADLARPEVAAYVRRRFDWVARHYGADVVLEKTCATSLRVPFVDRILPDARYIFIRRNGYDAVGSALHRWRAELDLPYLARKARFVPVTDLPYYASRYLWNRVYHLVSPSDRLAFWGPQLDGMPELLVRHSLEEVCAVQWQRCVESTATTLATLPATRWVEVAYEELVTHPGAELARIVRHLDLAAPPEALAQATAGISQTSIGKGIKQLGPALVARLEPLIGRTLARYGYA